MKKLFFLFLVPLLCHAELNAQQIKRVEGEYTFYAPDNITLEQAKNIAVERARLQALSTAFGMSISQVSTTMSSNRNGESDMEFFTSGGTEVKGEWLDDVSEPEISIFYEDGMLCVKAKVSGRARKIEEAGVDIDARILKNGTGLRDESDRFRNGDDFYLYFRSPVSGYLSVYLVDASETAYCLLPYLADNTGSRAVEPGRDYVFFSPECADGREQHFVDEFVMTCGNSAEQNVVYVIFSQKNFAKANDRQMDSSLPRQLAFADFQDWLTRSRIKDRTMVVERRVISVVPADY